jgi:hypothetical protein
LLVTAAFIRISEGRACYPRLQPRKPSVIVLRFRFAVKETSKAYAPASWPETCDAGFQR